MHTHILDFIVVQAVLLYASMHDNLTLGTFDAQRLDAESLQFWEGPG